MWEFVEDLLNDADTCPACGEPMVEPRLVPGYEDEHCRGCAHGIEKRRDWLNRRVESA